MADEEEEEEGVSNFRWRAAICCLALANSEVGGVEGVAAPAK